MRLFSFFRNLRFNKVSIPISDADEYVPVLWEDDYCQIEIVPKENKQFIIDQAKKIDDLAQKSKTDYGFTATFERGAIPVSTLSKELRSDYLEWTLTNSQFQKAKHIRYNRDKIINSETGKTKAFGFSGFTVFFDTKNEFVKNIWLHTKFIASVMQLELIETALYELGEGCEFILVDWNSLELFDLANKNKIRKYLMRYRK